MALSINYGFYCNLINADTISSSTHSWGTREELRFQEQMIKEAGTRDDRKTRRQLIEENHQLHRQLSFNRSQQVNEGRTLEDMELEIAQRNADLSKSEERFALAMRGANDGLWDWNMETDEVYYSPRWKGMLGYQENELENTLDTWKTLVHPDDKDLVLAKIGDYIEGRADSFETEMRMSHKDGQEIVVLSRAFLVKDDTSDKPARMVGTHVDITARKKSEQFVLTTSDILKMIATREPASDIYDAIALLYESRHPGMRCSMLILVGNKLMHGGGAEPATGIL